MRDYCLSNVLSFMRFELTPTKPRTRRTTIILKGFKVGDNYLNLLINEV